MAELRWGAATDPGRVRKANEDGVLAAPGVFAVADGMGGHAAGEVASAVALETVRDRLDPRVSTMASITEVVRAANEKRRTPDADRAPTPDEKGNGARFEARSRDGDVMQVLVVAERSERAVAAPHFRYELQRAIDEPWIVRKVASNDDQIWTMRSTSGQKAPFEIFEAEACTKMKIG